MVRIVIIEDSSFMQKTLTHLLQADVDLRVVGTAGDGVEGLRVVKEQKPDVVLLDIVMPRMDGLETLARLMSECPTPVVIVTASKLETAVKALDGGAVDLVFKPSGSISYDLEKVGDQLVRKVKAAAQARVERQEPRRGVERAILPEAIHTRGVLIGGSTGSARVLADLLPRLPMDFPAAILLVLHLAAEFLPALAERWRWECALPVTSASEEGWLRRGEILLCGSSERYEMIAAADEVRVLRRGAVDSARAIDACMTEGARVLGSATLGVLLSGMGEDGVEGLLAIKAGGGRTLVQEPSTCVVGSMPAAAIARGAADAIATPADLPAALIRML